VSRGVDFADGQWTPIIDRVTHEMLVAILNDPAKRTRGPGVKHLLSGLVVCGHDNCGAALMTHYARPGRREYWCQSNKGLGRPGCGRTVVAAEDDDPGAAAELKAAETRRDEIEHLYNSGQIRQDAFLRMHGPAVERVDKARDRLRAQASQSVLAELPTAKAELEAWWNDPARTVEEQRAVIQAVVSRVVVGPAVKPSRRFNEDRIRPPYGPQWKDRRPKPPQG
jgi:hypothetical protein